jgi:L-alanine-DL-glutamate epimerase-like enolase superfamily enzyme
MPGIKITGLHATPINIPLEKPMWWTGGHYSGTSKTMIEVEINQGLIGLDEATSIDAVDQIEAMGERLIGADPLDIAACEAMNIGFWCYSGDAGIATAGYLHMSAAMPWITEPSQSLFRWQIGDVIEGDPFRQKKQCYCCSRRARPRGEH